VSNIPTLKEILADPTAKDKLTDTQLSALIDQLKKLTRGFGKPKLPLSPADFAAKYSRGEWKHARHLAYLSDVLEKVERREIKRLLVSMPPRHGKSYLIDWFYPARWLVKHPKDRVILAGYGEQFSRTWGARVRDLIIEYSDDFNLDVNKQFVAADDWQTSAGGGMLSVGVGGALMGRGANLLIIDDPIKSEEEANSATYRDKMWDWWQTTAYTRLEPNGVVVGVMTRWHQDDLFGRIIAADEKKEWTVISIPALAEDDDPLGRVKDEPLWPERFHDDPDYAQKKRTLSPWWWAALYQQRPSPAIGGLIQRDWFRFYHTLPEDCDQWIQSWDLPLKDKEHNDYAVGQVWARKGGNIYLVDQVRGHFNLAQDQHHMLEFMRKYPKALAKLLEDTAMGPALKQTLQNKVQGIIPINVGGTSKRSRVENIIPVIQGGSVYLPERETGFKDQWVWDFIEECAAFPKGTNDDQVDAFSQAAGFMQPTAYSQLKHEEREAAAREEELTPRDLRTQHFNGLVKKALEKSAKLFNNPNPRRTLW
jgi:predicted phage terminase large subunit-like protein